MGPSAAAVVGSVGLLPQDSVHRVPPAGVKFDSRRDLLTCQVQTPNSAEYLTFL